LEKLITTLNHFYNTIQGWFDFQNIYTDAVNAAHDEDHFIEVGAWKGCSAAYMAVEIANSNKKIKFSVVDTWKGDPGTGLVSNEMNLKEIFTENMRKGGVLDFIEVITATSVEAAKLFEDESLDFVFIDANHSYENVKNDITGWFPKIKNGKTIAGHDYEKNGVSQAVNEFFAGRKIISNNSSWLVHK
jgi:hypothetical protein